MMTPLQQLFNYSVKWLRFPTIPDQSMNVKTLDFVWIPTNFKVNWLIANYLVISTTKLVITWRPLFSSSEIWPNTQLEILLWRDHDFAKHNIILRWNYEWITRSENFTNSPVYSSFSLALVQVLWLASSA